MPEIDCTSYPFFVEQIQQLRISHQGHEFEQQLSQFPLDYMIDLIYDDSQAIESRKMACSVLKAKLNNREQCSKEEINIREVLARLETLYMINSVNNKDLLKLQNSIEIVMEEIFGKYFDDMQKIAMFEEITEHMHKEPFSKQIKHLSILDMLMRQMDYLSLNSEVLVGQLVLFLGEVLKFIETNSLHLNDENIKNKTQQQEDFCEVIAKTVQLMREIKDIIDENNEGEENIATEFLINSKQLRTHLFHLLKMHFISQEDQQPKIITIWAESRKLNKAKVEILHLWHDVWEFYAEPDLLELLFTSVLTIQKSQAIDEIEEIISYCLILLERSCNHQGYNQIFFKMTQNLTVKLFELISITESEYSLISNDIDYFIEINDDFCKQQELETMKTRAGSLLANLTLAIDGYLTFVTQIALVAIRQHLTHEQKSENENKIWTGLLQSWGCTQEQLMETSILVLSSISDQVSKRKDLNLAVENHLKQMIHYLTPPSSLCKNPLFVLRYMQLCSFYSFPHCLDHFIRHYTSEKIYEQQLSKSYETVLRYYDRKNPEMEQYVKDIANSIMLLGDQLTPLLEQEIMRNNRVIQNFKENVLEKLVLWFLYSYEKCEILKINKLSTLIVRILHDNMKSEIESDKNVKPFSSETLSSYLDLIYKSLETSHPCEQTVIQIAISHIEYLFDLEEITYGVCEKFYNLGKIITERNNLSLNDCLMLFNSLICPDIAINRKGKFINFKFNELTLLMSFKILSQIEHWLQIIWQRSHELSEETQNQEEFTLREDDLWEFLQLTEICLFQMEANKSLILKLSESEIEEFKRSSGSILEFCLNLVDNCKSLTLKSKGISLMLQIVQTNTENTEKYAFITTLKYPNPCDFPAYECRKYLYFLINLMKNFMFNFDSQLRIRVLRVIIDLIYFLENEKAQIKSFEQKIFINGDAVSHNAVQKKNKIYSSFDFRIEFEPHDRFRDLIQNYPAKEELNFLNQEQAYQGKIRDLVEKIIVNDKTRKKFTVKRTL